jgi:hypothetical protein
MSKSVSKKDEIMTKLVNDEHLSKDDIIFIARNLDGSDNATSSLPFDHASNNILEACNITQEDENRMNRTVTEMLSGKDSTSISEIVEAVEALCATDNKFMRMTALQCVEFAKEQERKQSLQKLFGDGMSPLAGGTFKITSREEFEEFIKKLKDLKDRLGSAEEGE